MNDPIVITPYSSEFMNDLLFGSKSDLILPLINKLFPSQYNNLDVHGVKEDDLAWMLDALDSSGK